MLLNTLLQNFTPISLSIGLLILIFANKDFSKRTNTYFIVFISIILTLIVSGFIDDRCTALDKPIFLKYVVSSIGYTLRPASIVVMINILLRRRNKNILIWVPIIIVAVISITSKYTHLMFWFTDCNIFLRGPLTYISHIVAACYVILLLFLTIKMHNRISPSEMFAVFFSSSISVLATILETQLNDTRFLIPGAMSVSCTTYYVVLYADTYRRDSLTGLMNRRSLFLNAEKFKYKPFIIISLDMNGLKDINDNGGHNAGDKALKTLSHLLITNNSKNFLPFRTGGDEFIVLAKGHNETNVNCFINSVRNDLKKQNLMASFGYALYNSGDNFEEIFNTADKRMYADKKKYKSRNKCSDIG